MEKIFSVPLIDGYDIERDKTGERMDFKVVGDIWISAEEPPKVDGEYLLAIWDGWAMNYDVCYYFDGKWEVTNDWYEGKPIAYVAWMYFNAVVPLGKVKKGGEE